MSLDRSEPGDAVSRLGLGPGLVVQELGWDDDVDDALRQAIMDTIDADLIGESEEAVDVVLLWLRQSDGDVMDVLIDALTDLSAAGYIWVLSPKVGCPGHIGQADLAEGAAAGGLALTSSAVVSQNWSAHKVVRPKASRR